MEILYLVDAYLLGILGAIFGAILGSFASSLIWRLHFDEGGIFFGRSRCPKCKKTLQIRNLFPIFSYIFQRGACAFCREKIPLFYPAIEVVSAALGAIFVQKFWGSTDGIWILIFVFGLNLLFFYDAKFMQVDRRISFPLIFLAILFVIFGEGRIENWTIYVIGAAAGWGFYAAQHFFSGGKWVGAGDAELGLLMGVLLGWKFLILALFLAYILGSVFALFCLIFRRATLKSALPMGAFLMPATFIFLLEGQKIFDWYFGVLGF